MEVSTRQSDKPQDLPVRSANVEQRPRLSQIQTDTIFIRRVASIPTQEPAEWLESIAIKNDGSELYVWDGGAWRTFVSPSGASGTIDTDASQTITVVNGLITNIA